MKQGGFKMEFKDIEPGMKVSHPKNAFTEAGTGLVDKNFEGKTGKVFVNVTIGGLFFDAKDLKPA